MKKISKQNKGRRWLKIGGFFGIGVLTGIMLLIGFARITWHSKFFPGVEVGGVTIEGLRRDEAKTKIEGVANYYHGKLTFNGASWEIPAGAVPFEIDASLNEAYRYGRRLRIADYLEFLIGRSAKYPLVLATGQTEALSILIQEIAAAVEIPPVESSIEIVGKEVRVENGKDGVMIDGDKLDRAVRKAYENLASESIEIPTQVVVRHLGDEELEKLKESAQKLVGKSITTTHEDEKIILGDEALVALLAKDGKEEAIDGVALGDYVQGLAESLNREPQNARFVFEGGEVKEFAPGKDGVEINVQTTTDNLQAGIEKLIASESTEENVKIEATRTAPSVSTDKVNELGIRERIGRGESYYAHSIPNRIFNVGLASSRINSALIPPGEEFSFIREVGDISGATGYRTAYVISGGRTVLGDGGGVCQVSTTVFRAAMDAGLPITERWAHAYRVGYYEQNSKPGVDATIYAPSKDLRFLNDTPGHILVQAINDPDNLHLVIEIYGTSDGRVATITEPKVWGVSPPPPSLYQDDPSIPAGVVRQVDWSAWGAKTSFEYKVERDGQVIYEKTFNSSFRPWQNVFLRGTGV